MASSPVMEWRSAVSPNGTLSTQPLTGGGFNGAIPVGSTSTVLTVRLYNNFAGAANIADALSCVLAVYDDVVHQGTAVTTPATGQYIQVQVVDYNGNTNGADTQYYGIGGQVKHPIPVNGGTIGGAAANYCTINIQAVLPANATQGTISLGLWLEYSSTS